ncbi:putative multicopper oxidase [Annulohypoxylon maeteangense]|uniref:putative multicopper oxidase n=1 Tax=Annulohypoxylon maeteangense TaxID=1927788 RepID=UPI00200857EA|nr:putative multicopper oxidase [Annulohypoxylon maeteangense]KAI0889416.1 putative multicopper oxidase [Annulohypoxylon maeteangense]
MTIYRSSQPLSPMEKSHDEAGKLFSSSSDGDGSLDFTGGEEGNDATRHPLLASRSGDIEEVTSRSDVVRERQPWWINVAFIISCFGTVFPLTLLALSLDLQGRSEPSPLEIALGAPLRRPDEDYVLDPEWDFGAPNQVRTYDWIIVDKEGDPDGVVKPMMTINGQFPGPLVEVNEGDVVEVNVQNSAVNSTAIHWHGIFQNGTNWMDGAAGVTQCPISPGASFRYRFNVTGQAGTYFYHGHQGVQALSGLVGPFVVHSRDEATYQPIPYSSDRVVLLQDWYYDSDSGLMRELLSPGVEDAPIPNTALINGVNQADCLDHPSRACSDTGKSLPILDLARGQGHRLRFLNVGGFAWFQVAVDEHDSLPVIEADGTTVEPTSESMLIIAPGQRYSTVLTANQSNTETFWLRARMIKACFASQTLPENGIDEAKAIVRYHAQDMRHEDHESSSLPTTTSKLQYIPTCRDLSSITSLSPSPAKPAPEFADHSWRIRVNLAIGDWRLQRGVMNSSSFRPNLKSPTLHRVLDGLTSNNESFIQAGILNSAFDPESELVISHTGVSETVDIILQNMDENAHPFHLHGTQMWILGAGHGYFPGYNVLGLNDDGKGLQFPTASGVIENPLKRDTVTVEGFGWALLRFVADNPGVWLFHCHVIWHSEAGMGMQFISRIDSMKVWELPDESKQLCEVSEEELRKGAPPRDEIFFGFNHDGKR